MLILLLVAFVSGLLTIFAPCIWPILPIVLSTSVTGGKRRPFGVTLGILISFTLLTLSLSYLVKAFGFDPDSLRVLAIVIIMFLGIVLVVPKLSAILEGFASRFSRVFGGRFSTGSGFWGGLVAGISLGLVWAPCAGPILATIAALSATRAVNTQVVLVTFVYMIGTGIPLFLFATFGSKLITKSRTLSPFTGRIQQLFGIIMILTAILIWTGYDKVLQARLLDVFPQYSSFLYRLEQNNQVQQQLRKISGRGETNIQSNSESFLPNYGIAPDIIGIDRWLNSDPLTMESLRGTVVLVDFWTYSCINCIRTLPYLTGWYEKYKDQGLVIIGVHTPEFEFEKKTANVENAMKMFGITYPVAQDNNFRTWNNFDNVYWPAKYLIDKDRNIRYTHFGEGKYQETEMAIQSLLAEIGTTVSTGTLEIEEQSRNLSQTLETYLGANRMGRFGSIEGPKTGENKYTLPDSLFQDYFGLEGLWNISGEYSESIKDSALEINFFADDVFLVISPQSKDSSVKVYIDGNLVDNMSAGTDVKNGEVVLDAERLYHLIDLHDNPGRHILRLEFGSSGTKVFAFTFG